MEEGEGAVGKEEEEKEGGQGKKTEASAGGGRGPHRPVLYVGLA